MIIVRLQGGLGNQMFQYAAARGGGGTKKVILDCQTLEKNQQDREHFTVRRYELSVFKNLKAKIASRMIIKIVLGQCFVYGYFRKLFSITYVWQNTNGLVNFPAPSAFRHWYLNGYFQSETYFKKIRKQLLEEFAFPALDEPNALIKHQIQFCKNAVCLHVRRGDYLTSEVIFDVHGILPLDYYVEAVSYLQNRYAGLDLFVFSDDMDWCQTNLKFPEAKVHFISGNLNAGWKDMALMSACKHHVIANSSFSWWGAWLSKQGGEVFAPDRWFNSENVQFNIRDFIPENWQLLNVK